MVTSGFVLASDGVRIALESHGEGPPLLLVHGTGTHGRLWAGVRRLLEARFTVHAMDRRGHGNSGDAPPYAIMDEYEDIARCVEALGPGPVSVLAHSYGALCALGAAGRGARIGRLVLYEPPIPAEPDAYFDAGLIPAMRAALDRDDRAEAVRLFLSGVLALPPETIAALRRVSAWGAHMAAVPVVSRELQAVEALRFRPEDFASWSVPTLLLLGEESPPHYHATAKALRACLPGSVIETLPGQRHGAITAAPALVAAAAMRFLTGDQSN